MQPQCQYSEEVIISIMPYLSHKDFPLIHFMYLYWNHTILHLFFFKITCSTSSRIILQTTLSRRGKIEEQKREKRKREKIERRGKISAPETGKGWARETRDGWWEMPTDDECCVFYG